MKKKMEPNSSRSLNDLPDNIIDEILCRLPFKLAVRASVLSRSCRGLCSPLPNSPSSPHEMSSHDISRALLLHSAPLRLFRVQESPAGWDHCDVDVWLAVVSRRSSSALHVLGIGSKAVLNANLLAGYFPNLIYLYLTCPLVVRPHFSGFIALRLLHLCGCGHLCDLSRLMYMCQLLKTLTVTHVNLRQSLDIVALNLQVLVLYGLQLDDFTGP